MYVLMTHSIRHDRAFAIGFVCPDGLALRGRRWFGHVPAATCDGGSERSAARGGLCVAGWL